MINTNNAILPPGGISLKKLVIVLLVAAMVLGSLVGIFMYAGHGPNEDGGLQISLHLLLALTVFST